MSASVKGRIDWSRGTNKNGHRTYTIDWLVQSTDVTDGPEVIGSASGLAAVGSTWAYGNDSDPWAFCLPTQTVTYQEGPEPGTQWKVQQKFSTEPMNRCNTTSIEDPLNEPDRIGGSFIKYTKVADRDKDGDIIKNSSFEPITSQAAERDYNRPTVSIEKTLASNPLATFAPMMDTLNDAPLWGLPVRTIKLSASGWRRELYGVCNYYYVVFYEFDIDFSTFDKTIIDKGSRILMSGGDPNNQEHYQPYIDKTGNTAVVTLDGAGGVWGGPDSGTNPGTVDIQFYGESNFLLLGVPATL